MAQPCDSAVSPSSSTSVCSSTSSLAMADDVAAALGRKAILELERLMITDEIDADQRVGADFWTQVISTQVHSFHYWSLMIIINQMGMALQKASLEYGLNVRVVHRLTQEMALLLSAGRHKEDGASSGQKVILPAAPVEETNAAALSPVAARVARKVTPASIGTLGEYAMCTPTLALEVDDLRLDAMGRPALALSRAGIDEKDCKLFLADIMSKVDVDKNYESEGEPEPPGISSDEDEGQIEEDVAEKEDVRSNFNDRQTDSDDESQATKRRRSRRGSVRELARVRQMRSATTTVGLDEDEDGVIDRSLSLEDWREIFSQAYDNLGWRDEGSSSSLGVRPSEDTPTFNMVDFPRDVKSPARRASSPVLRAPAPPKKKRKRKTSRRCGEDRPQGPRPRIPPLRLETAIQEPQPTAAPSPSSSPPPSPGNNTEHGASSTEKDRLGFDVAVWRGLVRSWWSDDPQNVVDFSTAVVGKAKNEVVRSFVGTLFMLNEGQLERVESEAEEDGLTMGNLKLRLIPGEAANDQG